MSDIRERLCPLRETDGTPCVPNCAWCMPDGACAVQQLPYVIGVLQDIADALHEQAALVSEFEAVMGQMQRSKTRDQEKGGA